MEKPGIDLLHLLFYRQTICKQLALAWQIAKQLWGLNPLPLGNNKNYSFNGYLRYKTITFWNVSSEAQVKNFFFFRRKVIFRSQDIQVFLFLTIPRSTKSVTSWWVLIHETKCIFDYIF